MSRTRTRGSFTTNLVEWKHRYQNCGHTAWTVYGSGQGMKVGEVTTMIDEEILDFHKRRAKGEVFFNPMYRIRKNYALLPGTGWGLKGVNKSCNSPSLYHEVENTDTMSWICGPSGAEPVVPAQFSESEIQSLVTEASTSVWNKRGRTDANLWETLAEAHKAAALIPAMARSAANVITFGINEARRQGRQKTRVGVQYRDTASLWLQYRYGLRPIMLDIENVLKNIHNLRRYERKTTRALLTDQRSSQQTAIYGPVDGNVRVSYKGSYNHQLRVRAMSLDEFSIGAIEEIGFTTKGLVTLPWELIPYSFVVDWFLNVGDYFGSLVPAIGYDHKGGAVTVESIKTATYLPQQTYITPAGSYIVTRSVTGGAVCTHDEKYRTSLATPGMVVKHDFRFDTFTRAADALALVGQKLERVYKVIR